MHSGLSWVHPACGVDFRLEHGSDFCKPRICYLYIPGGRTAGVELVMLIVVDLGVSSSSFQTAAAAAGGRGKGQCEVKCLEEARRAAVRVQLPQQATERRELVRLGVCDDVGQQTT